MKPDTIKTSLLIATYNWPEALHLCLISVRQQSVPPTEIIIADDGSGETTKQVIEKFQKSCSIPLNHVWQKDNGFRLSLVRNKAIAAARFEYIIQIDGDVVLDKHFIQDHLNLAQKKSFLCGSRVLTNEKSSDYLLKNRKTDVPLSLLPAGYVLNSLRIPFLGRMMADHYKKKQLTALRGCNMSFWKADLEEVNGYDNSIQGWGSEDAELAIRLINSGKRKRFLKFTGIVYHLFHLENDRSLDLRNKELLKKSIDTHAVYTENGLKESYAES